MRRHLLALALPTLAGVGTLGACAEPVDDTTTSASAYTEATPPRDEFADRADPACHVVLRDFGPVDGETKTSSGETWRVFAGHIDVAPGTPGIPEVHFQSKATNGKWLTVRATPAPAGETSSAVGFTRWSFRIESETVPARQGGWTGVTLKLAPYLLAANGDRLFDHNGDGVAGPFATYEFNGSKMRLGDDPDVCHVPPAGREEADKGCLVTLRSIKPEPGSPKSLSPDVNGTMCEVFDATVDVADKALDDAALPILQYRFKTRDGWEREGQQWYELAGQAGAKSTTHPGYSTYTFRLFRHGACGDSGRAGVFSQYELEAIPFIRWANGNRLYDHNAPASQKHAPGLANDSLDVYGAGYPFGISTGADVCKQIATNHG